MEKIIKKIKLEIPTDKAFQIFVNEFNEWWPREYTWSQDKLMEIKIEGRKDGLCKRLDPMDFVSIGEG